MAFFGNAAIHGRSAPNILFAQSVLSSHSHTLTFAFVDGDKKCSNKNKQVVSFMLPYRCLLFPPVTTSCYLATNACVTVAEQRRALDKGARRRDRVLVRDRFRLCHCTCFRSFSCSSYSLSSPGLLVAMGRVSVSLSESCNSLCEGDEGVDEEVSSSDVPRERSAAPYSPSCEAEGVPVDRASSVSSSGKS